MNSNSKASITSQRAILDLGRVSEISNTFLAYYGAREMCLARENISAVR